MNDSNARGLLGEELRYSISNGDFSALSYVRDDYKQYLEDFIIASISDLQTGGNNSVITQMEKFLNSNVKITTIDDELYAFFHAHESLKTLGEKAIKNLLYDAGASVSGNQYAAQHTNESAYRDSESPSDIDEVWYRFRDLVDFGLATLFPGDVEAKSAVKNIIYNKNYYKQEIASLVNEQFGSNSWVYDSFIDETINNIQYDYLTSNTVDTQTAYTLTFSAFSGTFVVGETVTSGGTTAEVLYTSDAKMVIGYLNGTLFADGANLTAPSGATATVAVNGVTLAHEWYNNFSNVKTIESARALTSLIEGSVNNTNLWTLPEQFDQNWTSNLVSVLPNNTTGPDNTETSEKLGVAESNGEHYIQRSYNLTSYDTFDSTSLKFDNGTETFDTGAANADQTYTVSMFVKKSEYDRVRFTVNLDTGVENAHFNVNLNEGTTGTLFSTDGIQVGAHGSIPIGSGWYRVYMTLTFGFGFASLTNRLSVLNSVGTLNYTGQSSSTKIAPANNPGTYSYFGGGVGHSAAVGNGKYIVGSPYQTYGSQSRAGVVRIYDLDGTNEQLLTPGVSRYNAYFGWSIAVSNSKIAVGAYRDSVAASNSGAVYIYDLDGSNEIQIDVSDVTGVSASTYDYFGYDVAIGGNLLFVGCPYYDGSGRSNDGAVFVFDLDGNYVRTIQASDRANSDYFGFSVAASDTKVVIGAPYDDDNSRSASGSIYIFDHDGTNQVKAYAANPAVNDNIGRVVDTDGTKIVTGSPYADRNGVTNSGLAVIMDMDGSNPIDLVIPANVRNSSDYFGWDVSINDGKVAVGAKYDAAPATRSGRVFLYDDDGTDVQLFTADDAASYDYYGSTVVLSGSKLYVTAERDNSGRGSAYIYNYLGSGLFVWGAKLTNQPLGSYTSVLGTVFYNSTEYNIKTYTIERLLDYANRALSNSLLSPSPSASFSSFYDSTAGAKYNTNTAMTIVRSSLNIIGKQLANDEYYTSITENNAIPAIAQSTPTSNYSTGYSSSGTGSSVTSTLTKVYGERNIPVGITAELLQSDYLYSVNTDASAELQKITLNEAKVVKVYKRFRIDGSITDGPFTMNENVSKQGDSSVTGKVYGFYEDANYKYLDVAVTGGTWAITDIIVGATNSTSAQISAIENRLHVIDLKGTFTENISFKGYTSTETAEPVSFTQNVAAVIDNTGGTLTIDTATISGMFEGTSVLYPDSSREYLDVKKYAGLDLNVGNDIASIGHIRLTVTVDSTIDSFTVGNNIYRVVGGGQDTNNYGIITELDLNNNYIYYVPVQGTINNNDQIGDYSSTSVVQVGLATVNATSTISGAASARIQDIEDFGLNKRLYLTNVNGSFTGRDGLRGPNGYRSAVITRKELKARTKRYFKGFDGTQTTFDLTINNGTQYLPDPAGHMMIFVNGILQPPGAAVAYTAFSDKIQFNEAPDLGASFTGFYLGKLRQLDDISFEFDSLRQSFNLKRDEVFYSLTLTDGIQSSSIRPENNIIVSINGVLQEPGVGFEIVGSRIIFSEVPRFGSTFVAFSYVGSEAGVDADTVVPPVEAGDFIDIEGEVSDREVAVIESSNSLITFDYLGSVFGQNANASANLTTGFIEKVSITSGGSGYTSRPTVRLDSISGFDGRVKALVGVSGVTVTNPGSGYQNPDINVETTVPDDWTAPDLSLYGEEVIDPEIL